jgi:hypothetical protein
MYAQYLKIALIIAYAYYTYINIFLNKLIDKYMIIARLLHRLKHNITTQEESYND